MNRVLKVLLAAVVLVVAAWFGIDLTQGDSAQSRDGAATSESVHASASSTNRENSKTPETPQASQLTRRSGRESELPSCPTETLPEQANEVIDDILAGGPFEHPGYDGTHFGNYERVLPQQRGNYYREYTVDTPGVRHRGERRIVVGGGTMKDPDTWYYTADHYESFCVIPNAED